MVDTEFKQSPKEPLNKDTSSLETKTVTSKVHDGSAEQNDQKTPNPISNGPSKRKSRFDQPPPGVSSKTSKQALDSTPIGQTTAKIEHALQNAKKYVETSSSGVNGFEAKIPIPDELMRDRNINFVGLVIGPSGNTQKKLQRDLQCRINILSGDGEKVTKDTTNDLYFLVSALSQNRLNVAVAYLNQLISDPDTRESLMIDQANTGFSQTSGMVSGGELNVNAPDMIMIPADKVGLVIGKGGETVQDAMRQSGAVIRVEREHNPSHPTTREVQIQGGPMQVEKAKNIINSLVSDRAMRTDGQIEYEDYMNISQNLIGIVIGKSGETIKNIQKMTNCTVQIVSKGDPNDPRALKVVKLRGTAAEISLGKQYVLDLTSKYKTNPDIENRPLGNDIEIIAIPNNTVGTLLGKGGESVKRLAFLTGTRVQVLPADKQVEQGFDSSRYKKVSIRGDPDCIEKAKTEVQRLIDVLASTGSDTPVINPQSASTEEERKELNEKYLKQQSMVLPDWAVGSVVNHRNPGGNMGGQFGNNQNNYSYQDPYSTGGYGYTAPGSQYGYQYGQQMMYAQQAQQAQQAAAMGMYGQQMAYMPQMAGSTNNIMQQPPAPPNPQTAAQNVTQNSAQSIGTKTSDQPNNK